MNIGMVVYSATGNTKRVANQLKSMLEEKGDSVDYLEIKTLGDPKQSPEIRFEKYFDLKDYDLLVFGSFIEAFSLNRCMISYLKSMDGYPGKKAAMLFTQFFPKKWLGGNKALRQMKKLLEDKGFEVLGGDGVNWTSKEEGRQGRIDSAINTIMEII